MGSEHKFLVYLISIPALVYIQSIFFVNVFIWQCVFWDVRVLFKVSRVNSIPENYWPKLFSHTSRPEQVMGLLSKTNLSVLCCFCLNLSFAIDTISSIFSIHQRPRIHNIQWRVLSDRDSSVQPCEFYQWVTWNMVW